MKCACFTLKRTLQTYTLSLAGLIYEEKHPSSLLPKGVRLEIKREGGSSQSSYITFSRYEGRMDLRGKATLLLQAPTLFQLHQAIISFTPP